MSQCKSLNIDILPIVEYQVSIVEEDWTETPIDYKEYSTEMLPITEHDVDIKQNDSEIEYKTWPNFVVEDNQNSFTFLYCVAYRHPNLPEWIVARWYWNDEWLRFADGVWRDE